MAKTREPTNAELVNGISASALTFTVKHFAEFADELHLEGTARDIARTVLNLLAFAEGQQTLSTPAAREYLAGKGKNHG